MLTILKKNWFILGLLFAACLAIADFTLISVKAALWLNTNHGPDFIIILIFFLSGLALDGPQIFSGLTDYKGTVLALLLIFVVSPMLAVLVAVLPISPAIIMGLLLVASMPSTLSSGVVMTGAAGGNMAHALLITIIANSLAVVAIPLILETLLIISGESREIIINQLPIMIQIGTRVLIPLIIGVFIRSFFQEQIKPYLSITTLCNQFAILTVVWMASCQSRQTILDHLGSIPTVIFVTALFHFLVVLTGLFTVKILKRKKGFRESILFMGGQKTLPLSIILQVSLFSEYGIVLVVCVIHHIVHLIMDGFLISYLKAKR